MENKNGKMSDWRGQDQKTSFCSKLCFNPFNTIAFLDNDQDIDLLHMRLTKTKTLHAWIYPTSFYSHSKLKTLIKSKSEAIIE